jgi:hypothetical protein
VGQVGDASGELRRVASSMMVRYDHRRLQASALAKSKTVAAIRLATRKLDSFNSSWEELVGALPSVEDLSGEVADVCIGLDNICSSGAHVEGPVPSVPFKPSSFMSDGVSASAVHAHVPSDVSSPSSEEELDELLTVQQDFAALMWIRPRHSGALVHFIEEDQDTKLLVKCGKKLARSSEPCTGFWGFNAQPGDVCTACLRKLDQRVQSFIESW